MFLRSRHVGIKLKKGTEGLEMEEGRRMKAGSIERDLASAAAPVLPCLLPPTFP